MTPTATEAPVRTIRYSLWVPEAAAKSPQARQALNLWRRRVREVGFEPHGTPVLSASETDPGVVEWWVAGDVVHAR